MSEAFCKEKLGPLALRLALGLVCVWHGYLKIMAGGGGTRFWPRSRVSKPKQFLKLNPNNFPKIVTNNNLVV